MSTFAAALERRVEPTEAARGRVTLWLATAAVAGTVMMALELAAIRLYAPYFGNSVYVWGTMISVVMAALSAGYTLGGWLAGSVEPEIALYGAILCSAGYQLIVLYVARPILKALEGQGEFAGTGVATLVIFVPSMLCLAATGPLIVCLCSKANQIGSAAGKVYALSTIGGMAGILGTSFGLLPRIGTQATLEVLCSVSFVLAGSGIRARIRYPILLIPLAGAILNVPDFGWSENTVWTAESAYNLIRVVRQGTRTMLLLNHRSSVHTIREKASPWTEYYYDAFAFGPLLVHADRALVLGMGAGASIYSMRLTAPEVLVDAVEIDPVVVQTAVQWFGIDRSDPRLHIHVADARPWLLKTRNSYDLVQVDLYQGGPYIPFYLVTKEFFSLVRAHLNDDGLVMMNVFDAGSKRELLAATAATLRCVYPAVMVLPGAADNYMLMGFTQARTPEAIRDRISNSPLTASLRGTSISEISLDRGAQIFTDDRAPVEEITRRMIEEHQPRSD